jgi:TonB family protein
LRDFLTSRGAFGRAPKGARSDLFLEFAPRRQSLLRDILDFLTGRGAFRSVKAAPGSDPYHLLFEDRPWYSSLVLNLREALLPRKLPPITLTSQPLPVAEIWERRKNLGPSFVISSSWHVILLALLVIIPLIEHARSNADTKVQVQITHLELSPYAGLLPPAKNPAGGGGGGGERNPVPASKGRLPKFAMQQLATPQVVLRNPNPKMAAEPTVVVPPQISFPQPNLPSLGDPLAQLITQSSGPGYGGGIGTGSGGGIGSGTGPGVGPGWGGGIGGGAFRVGGGVSAPACIYCPDPLYSDEARKARYSGTVVLIIVVDTEGRATDIRVVRGLGMGLDEKAIEAVRTWRFRPGMRGTVAVPVIATVEVTFRLL